MRGTLALIALKTSPRPSGPKDFGRAENLRGYGFVNIACPCCQPHRSGRKNPKKWFQSARPLQSLPHGEGYFGRPDLLVPRFLQHCAFDLNCSHSPLPGG